MRKSNVSKVLLPLLLLLIMSACIILGAGVKSTRRNPVIEEYLGEYIFEEVYAPRFFQVHELEIYRERDGYYANYLVNGRMIYVSMNAKVIECDRGIALVAYGYNDNSSEPCELGEVFLGLSKVGTRVDTYWMESLTFLEENRYSRNCFYFVTRNNRPMDVSSVPEGFIPLVENKSVSDGVVSGTLLSTGYIDFSIIKEDNYVRRIYMTNLANHKFIVKCKDTYYINELKYKKICEEAAKGRSAEQIYFDDDWEWDIR